MQKLDAIADPDLRLTLLFARAAPRPVTADDVAAAHNIHRNVARARLERLVQAGLLVPSFERRTGRTGPGAGRPAKTFRAAPELSSIEFPDRGYDRLVSLFADALPQRERPRALREIGIAFGTELARRAQLRPAKRLSRAVDLVCSALRKAGYQAEVAEVDDARAVLVTPTCPLRPLVRADRRLATLDGGLWTGLLASALAPATASAIGCRTAGCHGSGDCRIRLSLKGS